MDARQLIAKRLYEAGQPLPLHALHIEGVSESAAGARLREMTRDGLTVVVKVPGKRFKAWALAPADLTLPLVVA